MNTVGGCNFDLYTHVSQYWPLAFHATGIDWYNIGPNVQPCGTPQKILEMKINPPPQNQIEIIVIIIMT
jgi:hypothetical protein